MTPRQGLPDLVFTANAGLVFNDRFCSSVSILKFAPRSRALRRLVSTHSYTVEHLPPQMFFEGAGDRSLLPEASLIAGYRIRSDVQGVCQHLAGLCIGKCCRWN